LEKILHSAVKAEEVAKEKENREAGRLFSVGESSVHEWKKAEIVQKYLHLMKRAMRFRRCLWPTIERKLLHSFFIAFNRSIPMLGVEYKICHFFT
jgi:hypothetical protein